MRTIRCHAVLWLGLCGFLSFAATVRAETLAEHFEPKPDDPAFEPYAPLKAPRPKALILKPRDRLAICGDSITEQRMYSRLIEDYLTMCMPHLDIHVRQFGWSGERAPGFLARMTNDCLRFQPTIATTCYGMNDHEYRPYEEGVGLAYRSNTRAIIRAFKAHQARVIVGSPGCVGKMPHWVKSASGTVEDLNVSLSTLRNIGLWVAQEEHVGFADVFWPMLTAGYEGRKAYGPEYAIAGSDGVHPGWAGQAIMAFAFLRALGLDGDLGVFTADLRQKKLRAAGGHKVLASFDGEHEIESRRYPFCVCIPFKQTEAPYPVCEAEDATRHDSIRSAMPLVPFHEDLNRLMLFGRNGGGRKYRVTWGSESRVFTSAQLLKGVNLAAEFPANPFGEAFGRVDAAVAAKQAHETRQIKEVFHGPEGRADIEAAAVRTEVERAPLEGAIRAAFVPVRHKLKIALEEP